MFNALDNSIQIFFRFRNGKAFRHIGTPLSGELILIRISQKIVNPAPIRKHLPQVFYAVRI